MSLEWSKRHLDRNDPIDRELARLMAERVARKGDIALPKSPETDETQSFVVRTVVRTQTPHTEDRVSFSDLAKMYDPAIRAEYERAARTDPHVSISLIEIPKIIRAHRAEQLRLKHQEYTGRLEREWSRNTYLPMDGLKIREVYKRDVLGILLEKGEVKTEALSRAYVAQQGTIDLRAFQTACEVIHAYVTDGGASIRGGTGLPNLEQRPRGFFRR